MENQINTYCYLFGFFDQNKIVILADWADVNEVTYLQNVLTNLGTALSDPGFPIIK